MHDQNNGDSNKADEKGRRISHPGLWGILFGGLIALGVLTFVSIAADDMTERIKFLTTNTLSIFVLVAIAVQAYIYRRQWETMERQWLATRNLVDQNERVVETMQGQLDAMKDQLGIMRETQKSFAIGERAYLIIEDVVFISKGENTRVLFTLFNGGRTPAFEVSSASEASLGVDPPTGKLKGLGHVYGEKAFMPAGTKKQVEAVFYNFTMTAANWQAVAAETVRFFVRGEFYYKDFQDFERVLPFCLGWDPSLNRFLDYKAKNYSEDPN
jgi:hypothetical protein